MSNKEITWAELDGQIKKGDHTLIAGIVGCTSDYVGMVLRGDRKSQRVLKVAKAWVDNREQFILTHQ